MRIAINSRVIETYYGGAKKYVIELIKALKKIDNKNTYFYYTYKKSDLLENFHWWRAWAREDNHILGDSWEQFYLPIQLVKDSVDIYHATTERLPFLKFKTKYVLTVHDLGLFIFPEFIGRKRYILYIKTLFRAAVKRADKIIAVSQNTKNDLIRMLGVEEEKIEVIHQGVDKKYRVLNPSICSKVVKNKYGITKNYIFAIGLFNPKKNLPALFSAFHNLKRMGINKLLVVVGFRLWRYQEILNNVKESIILLENVEEDDIPYFYNAADVFVYPSLYEGFGLPLLEAMGCGTPIAASNIASIPEVVGDAALLFDPLNIEEMTSIIEKLLKNEELRDSLRQKGFNRVKQFSWEKTAQKTLELYRSLGEK